MDGRTKALISRKVLEALALSLSLDLSRSLYFSLSLSLDLSRSLYFSLSLSLVPSPPLSLSWLLALLFSKKPSSVCLVSQLPPPPWLEALRPRSLKRLDMLLWTLTRLAASSSDSSSSDSSAASGARTTSARCTVCRWPGRRTTK